MLRQHLRRFSAWGIQCVCAALADVARRCVFCLLVFWRARALHIYLHGLFYYFSSGCMYISTQQLVRMFDGGDWDKSHSSGRQLLYKTWMWKPPDGILSACNSSARLTSLQTRNCKIESRPRWIVQPTYGARPGRASSTWRLSGSRIVMGQGQWGG